MKLRREITIHDKELRVGDRIKVKLRNETHWATAYKKKGSVIFFVFDDCLDELRPMNPTDTTEGGYEASELRKYLIELSEQIPEKLKKKMIPDGNGDYIAGRDYIIRGDVDIALKQGLAVALQRGEELLQGFDVRFYLYAL